MIERERERGGEEIKKERRQSEKERGKKWKNRLNIKREQTVD